MSALPISIEKCNDYYNDARRRGMREYSRNTGAGENGYLPFLEGIIKHADIVAEVDLGIVDIPLNLVRGSYSLARSISFAPNFMPLPELGTEFAGKWVSVCRAHLETGLRDAVKAYEYFNWFYIVEGNKRISVLKYFDAASYSGQVTRIIPKYSEDDPKVRIYYDFMEFYKKTRINSIWFTKEKSFSKLLEYMDAYLASCNAARSGPGAGPDAEAGSGAGTGAGAGPSAEAGAGPGAGPDAEAGSGAGTGAGAGPSAEAGAGAGPDAEAGSGAGPDAEAGSGAGAGPGEFIVPEYDDETGICIITDTDSDRDYKYILGEFYLPFRRIYKAMGGERLTITTGDAFLEYLKVFGFPDISEKSGKSGVNPEDIFRVNMSGFYSELVQIAQRDFPEIAIDPGKASDAGIFSTIGKIIKPRGKIKVAFAYASTAQNSSWTYSHEMGRQHVENVLGDYITTSYKDSIPESGKAYTALKRLAEQGNDVIFATSPAFINAALRAAIEFKKVKFLSCSETLAYKHVKTYFGRMYEPRFLAGIIAASVTKTNIIGYIGTYPMPGVISGINSFALGAHLVNPRVTIKVAWANRWLTGDRPDESANLALEGGADIITHHNALSFPELSKEFGVYTVDCDFERRICTPSGYIATPVWNWGVFYEKILKTMLGTFRGLNESLAADSGSVNFWWGLDTGIIDLYYSKRLVPRETQKLVELMRRMISSYAFHPFTGPIYDNKGVLRIPADEIADREQIMKMDWFVDGIDADVPKMNKASGFELPTIDMLESPTEAADL